MSDAQRCSAAIFASVATSPDAMKGSVSASEPIRAMSFVVPKSPSRFVTAAGQRIGIKTQKAIINEVVRREYDKLR
jgi:hypothetical protein